MPVSILKSRLVVVNVGGSWKPFDDLMKAVGLFLEGPWKPAPYLQFIS